MNTGFHSRGDSSSRLHPAMRSGMIETVTAASSRRAATSAPAGPIANASTANTIVSVAGHLLPAHEVVCAAKPLATDRGILEAIRKNAPIATANSAQPNP